jgi:predicted peroxiredoxin
MTTTTEPQTHPQVESSEPAAPDRKVLVCLNHGAEDPESVLISYLVGVESLRAGKEAVMFLTKDAVHVARPGFAATIDVPNAPSVAALHEEYVANGGRFFACPVCVRTRGMEDAEWVPNTQVSGVPSVLEYTAGGALVFNY